MPFVLATGLAAVVLPGTAQADAGFDSAVCDQASTSASATWSPPPSVGTSHSLSISLSTVCTGPGDDAGPWSFSFSATTTENCFAGSGTGSVSAIGPQSYTSTFRYSRVLGLIEVTTDPAGPDGDTASFFLVMPPAAWTSCPGAVTLTGLGMVGDTKASGSGAARFSGSGVISPGLTFLLTPNAWTLSGTATGVFGGVPGSCSFSASWTVPVDTAAGGQSLGAGSASCNGTGISISCPSISAVRSAAFLTLTGACGSAGTLTLNAALVYGQAVPPLMTYTAEGALTIA